MPSATSTGDSAQFRFEYTREPTETAAVAVVRALSSVTWADATEIPPLHDSVDTDSLDRLCSGRSSDVQIEFTHHGFDITLLGDERIELQPTGE